MQSQGSIHVLSRWEIMPPEFRIAAQQQQPLRYNEPIIQPGLLCFSRGLLLADEDERTDRMMRTCIAFPCAETAHLKRAHIMSVAGLADDYTLDDAYAFAGISLFGESTGNPMMALTHVRFGHATFRNTGSRRIEAGDDVYFLWPGTEEGRYRTTSANVAAGLRIAMTVGTDDFRDALETQVHIWLAENFALLGRVPANPGEQVPLDRIVPGYVASHYVGRCMLGVESGGLGAIMIG